MAQSDTKVDNGVNVEALLEARKALTDAPEAAQFQWRATCKWLNGTHSESTIQKFFGLGAEQSHKKKFTFDADHPEIFASEDEGATPVEYVLVGLASCLTAAIPAVRQLAKPTRTYSTGVAPSSSEAKISGWSASKVNF